MTLPPRFWVPPSSFMPRRPWLFHLRRCVYRRSTAFEATRARYRTPAPITDQRFAHSSSTIFSTLHIIYATALDVTYPMGWLFFVNPCCWTSACVCPRFGHFRPMDCCHSNFRPALWCTASMNCPSAINENCCHVILSLGPSRRTRQPGRDIARLYTGSARKPVRIPRNDFSEGSPVNTRATACCAQMRWPSISACDSGTPSASHAATATASA